jgi:putative membrane protein
MTGVRAASYPKAPQYLGLALIASGVLALLISIWQYWWVVRYMWGAPFSAIAGMRRGATREQMHSPVIAIAILLTCIGLFAFFAVLFRQI